MHKHPADFVRSFWKKVAKSADLDGCWLWTSARDASGYGAFRGHRSHRLAYQLAGGQLRRDRSVCHTCDNPACVNPAHLRMATHAGNMRDKATKGRGGNTGRRLTDAEVAGIREMLDRGLAGKTVAFYSGVSLVTVYKIKNRKRQLASH